MLVKVINKDNGNSMSLILDLKWNLSQVRQKLEDKEMISKDIMFFYEDAMIVQSDEADILLEEVLKNTNILTIAKTGEIDLSLRVSDFTSLSKGQILNYLKKKQLYRGIIFSKKNGIGKSFSDVFTLSEAPKILVETENTSFCSSYAFSKEACTLDLMTSNKSSLALNTPYFNAGAEYSEQKSKKTNEETVTEHLLSKFVVSLVSFQIEPEICIPVREFVEKVNSIITARIENERKMLQLMDVTDEFGLYIPVKFTMGGAMYANETTEIKDFSMAEDEKRDFSTQADSAFSGYGGSISFNGSEAQGSGTSVSTKYKNIEVKQIGGEAGNTENKEFFRDSLSTIANWAVVDITEFYPIFLLLVHADKYEGMDPLLFIKTRKIFTDFSMHKFVSERQPYINMQRYVNELNEAFLNL